MKVGEPFTGIGIGMFAWTAYLDGAIWQSGCCAGVGAMMIVNWLCTMSQRWVEKRRKS